MKTLFALLFAVLLCQSCATTTVFHPVAPWKRVAVHSALALSMYGDARLSRYAVVNGGSELNPAADGIIRHKQLWYGLKFSVSIFNIIEAERAYRRGAANWWQVEAIVTGVSTLATASTIRQIHVHNEPGDRKAWWP